MRFGLMAVVLISMCLGQTQAEAKKVYSPIVKAGDIEVETQTDVIRSKIPSKNGKSKHQFEMSYGVSDWWRSGIYMVYEKNNNTSLNYTQNKWANIFQLTEQGKYWLDVGMYVEYIWAAAGRTQPDVLELKVLLEKPMEHWKHTLNVVFEKVVGSNVTALGYAWRSRYKTVAGIELGFEAYGALGTLERIETTQQNHLLGPVLDYEVTDAFEASLGWLMSTHEGPAYGSLKLNFEYEF